MTYQNYMQNQEDMSMSYQGSLPISSGITMHMFYQNTTPVSGIDIIKNFLTEEFSINNSNIASQHFKNTYNLRAYKILERGYCTNYQQNFRKNTSRKCLRN